MRLLAKFRNRRRAPSQPPTASRPKTPRSHRWFWFCAATSVAALLGLFFWFTSARLLKEPIVFDHGPRDAAFVSAFGPIVGAEFTDGNKVQLLVNGVEFFPAMLQAIREAKKTITFETYIWAPGKISDDFITALSERARAGVKVHVLVDGMGTLKFKDEDAERMRDAGVEFLKYGREHWYEVKPNINHRTHRKLLVETTTRDALVKLIEQFVRDGGKGWGTDPYGVSKAALNALSRILAVELADRAIKVNSTCPGWVRTDMGGRNAPRSVEDGGASVLYGVTTTETGGVFRDGRRIPF